MCWQQTSYPIGSNAIGTGTIVVYLDAINIGPFTIGALTSTVNFTIATDYYDYGIVMKPFTIIRTIGGLLDAVVPPAKYNGIVVWEAQYISPRERLLIL
ncbi:hypothetical protein SJAV_21400 [Sulfurisphaera javensis]|uniref:Uncharacterized protein n=1 Tax=Sulfurisphaera javensis TaxID=2049879 RepID=A0AAT9GTB1_9CREN